MLTWKDYEYERERRQDKITQAMQYRMVQSATENCETTFTKISIRMLDAIGSRLVQWGNQLQCRCAEMDLSASKRAI
ncbi:MAG: hypothetical protein MUO54_12965 [Anaerolineales bacterium]|nr:hypothetical protein [Anaerolineales bacterium]